MNKCPKCGEPAVKVFDKLFKTNKLVCQNCGEKLQIPSMANYIISFVTLVLFIGVWSLDATSLVKFGIIAVIILFFAVVFFVLPLQSKPNQS